MLEKIPEKKLGLKKFQKNNKKNLLEKIPEKKI